MLGCHYPLSANYTVWESNRIYHPNRAPGGNESEAARATTRNNLHIPDELPAQAEKLAASQGRTVDDLSADALKPYLATSC